MSELIDQEVIIIGEGLNCGNVHQHRIGTVICFQQPYGYLVVFEHRTNGTMDGAWFPPASVCLASEAEMLSGLPDEDFWELARLVDRERVLREAMRAAVGGRS